MSLHLIRIKTLKFIGIVQKYKGRLLYSFIFAYNIKNMRAIIQRVRHAKLSIDDELYSSMGQGILVLLGIEPDDQKEDINWITQKITSMRIFSDDQGKMNLSVLDVGGDIMVVSQFTLHAKVKKGNRPSFIRAAKPDVAIPLYEQTVKEFEKIMQKAVPTGEFGADMQIELLNSGPVTIWLDSKRKE